MNKLDQHIKNKLSQQQAPPLDAWRNIQEKLDEKEKKRRIIPLFYWVGSTAACLVLGISIFYFNHEESTSSSDAAREIVKKTSNSSLKKEQSNKEINHNIEANEGFVHQTANEKDNLNDKSLKLTQKETKQNNKNRLDYANNPHSFKNYSDDKIVSNNLSNTSLKIDGKEESFIIFPEILSNKNLTAHQTINKKDNLNDESLKLTHEETKQNNLATSKIDSITRKEVLDNILNEKPLELVLEEEQKEIEKEKEKLKSISPKFMVSSYVNPTKLLDSKSILSDEFSQNNINNSLTIAYGAKVALRVNDKMNIRSGISKIELEQHTNNVGTLGNNAMSFLANSNINLNSQNNIRYNQNYIRVLASNNVSTMLSSSFGELEQKIHYVEIPLELEYKLANYKNFNLLATAGGSYYLVTKNEISLKGTNSRNVKIGEASNLNSMNYSANAGLKLEYLLSEKTSINLEPNYRYMINTLNNVETKNPSLLGINLGFTIRF